MGYGIWPIWASNPYLSIPGSDPVPVSAASPSLSPAPSQPKGPPNLRNRTFGVELEFLLGKPGVDIDNVLIYDELVVWLEYAGLPAITTWRAYENSEKKGKGYTVWDVGCDAGVRLTDSSIEEFKKLLPEEKWDKAYELFEKNFIDCEIASPIMTVADLPKLQKVCYVLTAGRAIGHGLHTMVNPTTGLHVHVYMGKEPGVALHLAKLGYAMYLFEPYRCFLSPFYRVNAWCKRNGKNKNVKDMTREEVLESLKICVERGPLDVLKLFVPGDDEDGLSKYFRVNLSSWNSYGTVEFREHEGTLDYEKIMLWVFLCLHVVELARWYDWEDLRMIARMMDIIDEMYDPDYEKTNYGGWKKWMTLYRRLYLAFLLGDMKQSHWTAEKKELTVADHVLTLFEMNEGGQAAAKGEGGITLVNYIQGRERSFRRDHRRDIKYHFKVKESQRESGGRFGQNLEEEEQKWKETGLSDSESPGDVNVMLELVKEKDNVRSTVERLSGYQKTYEGVKKKFSKRRFKRSRISKGLAQGGMERILSTKAVRVWIRDGDIGWLNDLESAESLEGRWRNTDKNGGEDRGLEMEVYEAPTESRLTSIAAQASPQRDPNSPLYSSSERRMRTSYA